VRQARAEVIAFAGNEYLRLSLESTEGLAVNDTAAIALER
jgi:hypothetical protein